MYKAAKKTILQAYSNAPWRSQAQLAGGFVVGVVVVGLILAVYGAISVETANIGRQTQELQLEILEIQLKNANLQTRLATLTSATRMRDRAEKLGFRELTSYDMQYVSVPGYVPMKEVVLAPPPGPTTLNTNQFPVELNQTLFDWLQQQINPTAPVSEATNLFSQARPASPFEP